MPKMTDVFMLGWTDCVAALSFGEQSRQFQLFCDEADKLFASSDAFLSTWAEGALAAIKAGLGE